MSSEKGKKALPVVEPHASASDPQDYVYYGNPNPGLMQDFAKNRRFEEWKHDCARWKAKGQWERGKPKHSIIWSEIKW